MAMKVVRAIAHSKGHKQTLTRPRFATGRRKPVRAGSPYPATPGSQHSCYTGLECRQYGDERSTCHVGFCLSSANTLRGCRHALDERYADPRRPETGPASAPADSTL